MNYQKKSKKKSKSRSRSKSKNRASPPEPFLSPSRFSNQKNSVKILSKPNPEKVVPFKQASPPRDVREGVKKQVTSGNVPEMRVEQISPVKLANDGLHMPHEHAVITRDQPQPIVQKPVRPVGYKIEAELKGWNNLTDQSFNAPEKKVTKMDKTADEFNSLTNTLVSKGSDDVFQIYTKQEKQDQMVVTEYGTERSKKSPNGKKDTTPSLSLGGRGINLKNYQNQEDNGEQESPLANAVVKRLSKDAVDKERKRNQREKKNNDLNGVTPQGMTSPLSKAQSPVRGSVIFDDQVPSKSALQVITQDKKIARGILKSKSNIGTSLNHLEKDPSSIQILQTNEEKGSMVQESQSLIKAKMNLLKDIESRSAGSIKGSNHSKSSRKKLKKKNKSMDSSAKSLPNDDIEHLQENEAKEEVRLYDGASGMAGSQLSNYLPIVQPSPKRYMVQIHEDMEQRMKSIVKAYMRETELKQEKFKNNNAMDQIRLNRDERQKHKYEQYPVYKDITDAMSFDEDEYEKLLDQALHPKNSPITPAEFYICEEDDEQQKELEKQKHAKDQLYEPNVPLTEEFAGVTTGAIQQRSTDSNMLRIAENLSSVQYDSRLAKMASPYFSSDHDPEQDLEVEETIDDMVQEEQKQRAEEQEKEVMHHNSTQGNNIILQKAPRDSLGYTALDGATKEENAMKIIRGMIQNPDEVKQIEKVFKMMHDYCSENLNVSMGMLDKHINDLLDPDKLVSPLLKYFNELAKYSYFRMPSKSILEFDQQFFRIYLEKYRKAQKVELRWLKKTVSSASRQCLIKSFDQARKLMQKEFKEINFQFDDLKEKLRKQEEINEALKKQLAEQEGIISKVKAFSQATISKMYENDRELFQKNGGPGGAYDQIIPGNVITNLIEYNSLMRIHCQDEAQRVIDKLEQQRGLKREVRKLTQSFGTGLMDIVKTVKSKGSDHKIKHFLRPDEDDLKPVITPIKTNIHMGDFQKPTTNTNHYLGSSPSVDSQLLEENPNLGPNIRDHPLFNMGITPINKMPQYEKLLPTVDEHQNALEPLMKKQFNLFSGHIQVQIEDINSVMSQEMYKYLKMELASQGQKNQQLQTEYDIARQFIDEYTREIRQLKGKLMDLETEVISMKKQFDIDKARIQAEAEAAIEEMRIQSEKKVKEAVGFMTIEINVAETIKSKIEEECAWMREKLKKFAYYLRVPREHHKYLDENGVDEFVEYTESIVKREKAKLDDLEAKRLVSELRKDLAVKKVHQRRNPDFAREFKSDMFDERVTVGTSGLEVKVKKDLQRDDHRAHARAKWSEEDRKIWDKIQQINWLKQHSIVDLADLIEQHKDRQPQLLASLMPDIKQQILLNPHFFKNLERLEKQDPINKKVKDVRQFVQALKQETFERHFTLDEKRNAEEPETRSNQISSPLFERKNVNFQEWRKQMSQSINKDPTKSAIQFMSPVAPRMMNRSIDLTAPANRRYDSLNQSLNEITSAFSRIDKVQQYNTIDPDNTATLTTKQKFRRPNINLNEQSDIELSAIKIQEPSKHHLMIESRETIPGLSGSKTSKQHGSPFASSVDLSKGMHTISQNKIVGQGISGPHVFSSLAAKNLEIGFAKNYHNRPSEVLRGLNKIDEFKGAIKSSNDKSVFLSPVELNKSIAQTTKNATTVKNLQINDQSSIEL